MVRVAPDAQLTTFYVREKKTRKVNRTTWLKGKLRNLSIQWPEASEADRLATPERGKRICASCQKTFHYKQVQKDHTNPVIPLTGPVLQPSGEIDWNVYIDRLFVLANQFQVLCIKCHDNKTNIENEMRTYYRDQDRKKNSTKLRKK